MLFKVFFGFISEEFYSDEIRKGVGETRKGFSVPENRESARTTARNRGFLENSFKAILKQPWGLFIGSIAQVKNNARVVGGGLQEERGKLGGVLPRY